MALVAAALAVLKLAWVRWSAPELVSKRTAILLGVHVAFVIALPLAAAHLAASHRLSPLVLYGFWWLTAALPAAMVFTNPLRVFIASPLDRIPNSRLKTRHPGF